MIRTEALFLTGLPDVDYSFPLPFGQHPRKHLDGSSIGQLLVTRWDLTHCLVHLVVAIIALYLRDIRFENLKILLTDHAQDVHHRIDVDAFLIGGQLSALFQQVPQRCAVWQITEQLASFRGPKLCEEVVCGELNDALRKANTELDVV